MKYILNHKPKVVVHHIDAAHLNQIYDGFGKLAKAGVIDLHVCFENGNPQKGWTYVDVDDKRVVYDCMDGPIWLDDTINANLDFLSHQIHCDYYFKRSFDLMLLQYSPKNCKMFPLGANYCWQPEGPWIETWSQKMKMELLANPIIATIRGKKIFKSTDFECMPHMHKKHRVLFLARLWDPDEHNGAANPQWQAELRSINEFRMECVRRLSLELGEQFIGGLERTAFAETVCQEELLVPKQMTRRDNFLKMVKESDICIATTGLHQSTGWKFGEYLAASRAIVTEPLFYQLPGDFCEGKNYLSAKNVDEVLTQVKTLLDDEALLQNMMIANHDYYEQYVRPDSMVLNTLKIIEEDK